MSRLRRVGSFIAVPVIAIMMTRTMNNPTTWRILDRPVAGIVEVLRISGQEGTENVFGYLTLSLSLVLAVALVIGANRLVTRRTRK